MDNSKREEQIMNIQFKCPQCGQMVEADESVIGYTALCPYCDKRIIVPKDRIQKRSTTVENIDVPLRKPISSNAALSALLSCLNVKSLALFSAICVLIIIIQSIMLIVLFAQRTAVNNSGHTANSIQTANYNQAEAPSEQFLKYTELGELSYVETVLKQNPALDVNRPRAAGNKTALYIACEKGYADIAKFLLSKKADASICDTEKAISSTRYSPLTVAAKNGHLAVVKGLLSSGIDIEARDDGNRTALYAAAAGNKPDVVRFLCESNAKVNILARHNSWSPLSAAIHNGYVDVVKTLLKYGKGIDLEMRIEGKTVLYNAVKANRPDIVRLLCESNAKVNVFLDGSDTPLTIAAGNGFTEMIRVLLKYGKGIDLEKRCHCWYSAPPLYHAAIKGHVDAIAVLCEAGADLSARSGRSGDTPLKAASTQGHEDAVKVLKKYESERERREQSKPTECGNVSTQKTREEAHTISQQREVEKPTKEFSGQISRVDDDCLVFIRDFSKSGVFFGIERKVILDGIMIKDKSGARDFVRRRCSGKVRVTYKDLDEAKNVKGTIWEDGGNGIRVKNIWTGEVARKSLNDILVDQGYASYDKQTK